MTKRIKVLQLQLHFNIGISSLADQVIQGLPADRFEVTNAFLSGQPGPEDNENTAVKSICFNFEKSELKGWRRLKALWRLYKKCRDEQ